MDVIHTRSGKGLGLRQARIEFLLETISEEHIETILNDLSEFNGKRVNWLSCLKIKQAMVQNLAVDL